MAIVINAIVGTAAIGAPTAGAIPSPVPGSQIPPLADSAVVYEYSYSTGTGPYSLAGAYGSWKTFADAYDDGTTVYYRATDQSARTEYVVGTFNKGAGTLTRDIILGSTNNGNPIDWSGRTRVLVHALVQGLPLCTTPPQDGQVLTWDATEKQYCPRTPVVAAPTPMALCPTPPTDGQVLIWSVSENAYCPADFCALVAACLAPPPPPPPPPGPPPPPPPPPVWAVGVFQGGGPNGLALGNGGFAGVVSLAVNRIAASGNLDNGLTTTGPSLVVACVKLTQTSQINQIGTQPASPNITTVFGTTLGTFTRLASQAWALDTDFFPPGYTKVEIWYAVSNSALTDEFVQAEFDGYVVNADIGVIAFYDAILTSPWDSDPSLPASAYQPSKTTSTYDRIPGVSTAHNNTVIIAPTSSNDAVSWPGNTSKYTGNPYLGMLIANTDPAFSDYLDGMVIFLDGAPAALSSASIPLPDFITTGGSMIPVDSFFNSEFTGDAQVPSWATLVHAIRLYNPAPPPYGLLIPVQ